MSLKLIILLACLTLIGCAPLSEEGYDYGGSSLMGVSPSGRTAISGSLQQALSGYTGQVSGGVAYVGGGYGGNGLAGQMHCQVGSGAGAWFSNCNNVTTQGFLPPGKTFGGGSGGQSLWSWSESTDRIMRIVGASPHLQKNDSLSSAAANESTVDDNGQPFEDLMATNNDYFSSLQQPGFEGSVERQGDIQSAEFASDNQNYSGLSLTSDTSLAARPVYEEYSANKLASLRCQVGSKSASYNDVIEVVLRKRSAVLNAYFAKGVGYVGYKYVRAGNGGGSGTNILVCIDTQKS